MSAVAGIRRTMKELVDGTIRVQVDIEPQYRDAFLKLFPQIDMPVALAPLNLNLPQTTTGGDDDFDPLRFDPVEIGQIVTFSISDTESKELGGTTWTTLGPLCRSAIMLGKDEAFQKWVDTKHPTWPGEPPPIEERAALYIRARCLVDSRKQLDEKDDARASFRDMMREYRAWIQASR